MKKNIDLKKYTTVRIGGPAKFFCEVDSSQLSDCLLWARESSLPFFILGGGSNVLISDKGIDGLVIKIKSQDIKTKSNIVEVGAGNLLSEVLVCASKKSLSGLEWAVGIPGTIGGAIFGNAGSFGFSIGNNIKEVLVLNSKTLKTKVLQNKDCGFNYRQSIFSKNKHLIILSAKLKLKKGKRPEIDKRIKENLLYKKQTQPLEYFSCGSVFKNPSGSKSAGFFIEQCGLKGKKIGQAQISLRHANFIVNLGNATSKDFLKLVELVKEKVHQKFKIKLQEEIIVKKNN